MPKPTGPPQMFCVKGNKVIVAKPGMADSHFEWFRKEGWIGNGNGGNEESFFNHVVNGYYVPGENALYCFREADFLFNEETIDIVMRQLAKLKKCFDLGPKTKVFIGLPDDKSSGEDHRQKYLGTLNSLVKQEEKDENVMGDNLR